MSSCPVFLLRIYSSEVSYVTVSKIHLLKLLNVRKVLSADAVSPRAEPLNPILQKEKACSEKIKACSRQKNGHFSN